MAEEIFTEPEETTENWVDVRMTNPEEGEWDVDFVVVDGQVNYVDLRIRPELLRGFVECLIDDVGDEHAGSILTELAERTISTWIPRMRPDTVWLCRGKERRLTKRANSFSRVCVA